MSNVLMVVCFELLLLITLYSYHSYLNIALVLFSNIALLMVLLCDVQLVILLGTYYGLLTSVPLTIYFLLMFLVQQKIIHYDYESDNRWNKGK